MATSRHPRASMPTEQQRPLALFDPAPFYLGMPFVSIYRRHSLYTFYIFRHLDGAHPVMLNRLRLGATVR